MQTTSFGFLSFLGISKDKAETTELSTENLDSIHAEMERLKTENATLVQAKADIEEKLNSANAKITELNGSTSGKDRVQVFSRQFGGFRFIF